MKRTITTTATDDTRLDQACKTPRLASANGDLGGKAHPSTHRAREIKDELQDRRFRCGVVIEARRGVGSYHLHGLHGLCVDTAALHCRRRLQPVAARCSLLEELPAGAHSRCEQKRVRRHKWAY